MALAIEKCYRRYGPMVLRRCRALLHDEELARDVMHDVFVKVLNKQDELEDRGLSSLLYRIATNECLNRMRYSTRRPEDSASELICNIAKATDDSAQARSLLRALFVNDDKSALIAVLHLHDGFTLEEVAAEVSMSVSGVRKRLRQVRGRLQNMEDAA